VAKKVGKRASQSENPSKPFFGPVNNQIGPAGAEFLAGVLGQCTALTHLNLGGGGDTQV